MVMLAAAYVAAGDDGMLRIAAAFDCERRAGAGQCPGRCLGDPAGLTPASRRLILSAANRWMRLRPIAEHRVGARRAARCW